MNLAVNARDAMPAGGTLTVQTRNVEIDQDTMKAGTEHRRQVTLSVSDTGVGMDAETQSRIFEPFFTTKELGKGTGLGLSTAYGIIAQSDGVVRVDSKPGRGTTFRVYLPLVEAAADPPVRPDTDPGPVHGSETVLLAEDDDALRRLVQQTLEADGYTVLPARNASEAIDVCDRHQAPIDLLITDVVMPGGGGLDLARELRARRPGVRLLFMSGYSEHGITDQDRRQLDAGFIQKPFPLAALSRKIREQIDAT